MCQLCAFHPQRLCAGYLSLQQKQYLQKNKVKEIFILTPENYEDMIKIESPNTTKKEFEEAVNKEQQNKQVQHLADLIDKQIYSNFKLWPNNYVAYDLLMQEHRFKNKYTLEEEKNFKMMVEQAMIHIDFPITDIQERFLKLYANPVINKLKVTEI